MVQIHIFVIFPIFILRMRSNFGLSSNEYSNNLANHLDE